MKEKDNSESQPDSININPDYPINAFDQDKFQRGNFAKGIARIINSGSSEKSTVLGIYGEWGSGKTSILKLISVALKEQDEVVQIYFNPWRFHDEKELLLSFFFTLADSLDESLKKNKEKVGNLIKEYSGFLKPLSWFVPDVANPEQVANALGSKLSEVQLETLKNRIETILKNNGKKIVIYIDDIDRLNRVEIQSVFKLVKLTGNFANTHYILAFDDKLVAQSLGPMFGEGNSQAGFNFLEKIIQTPIKLPQVQRSDLMSYCVEKLNDVMENLEIDISEDEARRYLHVFWVFEYRLTTPRMAVRYANTLRIVCPMLKDEVNIVDLLLIEAVRIFYPDLYSFIANEPSFFLKRRSDLGMIYELPKGDEVSIKKLFDDCLQQYTSKEQNGIKELLHKLFPMFHEAYNKIHYPDIKMKELTKEMRISSPEHFNRYFSYTVLKGEVPNSFLKEFLQTLEKENQKKVDADFSEFLKIAGADSVLSRVRVFQDELSGPASKKLIISIAKNFKKFISKKGFLSFTSLYSQVATDLSHLIRKLDSDKRFQLIKQLSKITNVEFMLEVYKCSYTDDGVESLLEEEPMKDFAKLIVDKALDLSSRKCLWDTFGVETTWLLKLWSTYDKEGQIKLYLKSCIDESSEEAKGFLKHFAPLIHSTSAPNAYRGDLEMSTLNHIEKYIELKYIYNKLKKLRKEKTPNQKAEYKRLHKKQNESNMIEQFIFLYKEKLDKHKKEQS
ncbi:MAG: P-loop NTPase fold protein [Brumimicrobium sp.]